MQRMLLGLIVKLSSFPIGWALNGELPRWLKGLRCTWREVLDKAIVKYQTKLRGIYFPAFCLWIRCDALRGCGVSSGPISPPTRPLNTIQVEGGGGYSGCGGEISTPARQIPPDRAISTERERRPLFSWFKHTHSSGSLSSGRRL